MVAAFSFNDTHLYELSVIREQCTERYNNNVNFSEDNAFQGTEDERIWCTGILKNEK